MKETEIDKKTRLEIKVTPGQIKVNIEGKKLDLLALIAWLMDENKELRNLIMEGIFFQSVHELEKKGVNIQELIKHLDEHHGIQVKKQSKAPQRSPEMPNKPRRVD